MALDQPQQIDVSLAHEPGRHDAAEEPGLIRGGAVGLHGLESYVTVAS